MKRVEIFIGINPIRHMFKCMNMKVFQWLSPLSPIKQIKVPGNKEAWTGLTKKGHTTESSVLRHFS